MRHGVVPDERTFFAHFRVDGVVVDGLEYSHPLAQRDAATGHPHPQYPYEVRKGVIRAEATCISSRSWSYSKLQALQVHVQCEMVDLLAKRSSLHVL